MLLRFEIVLNKNFKPLPFDDTVKRINEGIKARGLKRDDIISITHELEVVFVYYWDNTVTE